MIFKIRLILACDNVLIVLNFYFLKELLKDSWINIFHYIATELRKYLKKIYLIYGLHKLKKCFGTEKFMDEMIYCLDFFQTYPEKEVGGYIHKENKIGYGLINVEYG